MLKRFSEIRMKDVSICGGKGASLGEMMNAGLPIPNGFVLTTKAYGKNSKERENQVLEAFDKLNTKFVAVRSSGTKEDGVDDSFAGQFDTYLFVTRENIIEKIKECHDSVNSERIISYCEYKGIDRKLIKVAVVVQKMVNSDSAGVCFTVNPVSQNHDEIMIDAGFGVGEAVVSGMITPDNYIVNKKTGEIKKNISQQTKKLVLSDKGGTEEVEITEDEQSKQKLSDENIKKLSELAVKIEKHYGKPMDTEWAVENGELFMLQARPITTLGDKKLNNLEVKLGNKTFTPEFRKHQNTIHFSYQGVPFFSCIFSKCCTTNDTDRTTPANYVCEFNNLETATQYVIGNFVKKGENMIENMVKGKKDASIFLKKQDKIVLKCIEKCDKYIRDGKINFFDIRNDIKLAFEAGCHVINLSYALQKYLENVSKTNQNLYKNISENINAPKKSFVNEAGDYLKKLIKKYPDNFENVYNEFTEKYGWFQNSYLGINHIDKKRLKEYAEDLLKAQISKKSKKKTKIEKKYNILVETASNAIIYQDNKKRLGFMAMQIMENRLRDYSKKIKIPYNDLLWLTIEEIIENDEKIIKNKINEYKQTGKRLGIMTEKGYADIPEEFWLKVVDLNRPQNNIKSFNGITGCKGKYTGNVKIISNIEKDKNKFKKGDILVTGMTRPEFVSLIKKAGGIITNEGGITCHAAIISRELGKPCVIGTKIATQILKDGDLVEVDADNGIVKILKDDNNVSNPGKSTEYIRMFQTLYLPFINAYILNSYYKKLGVISIYRNDTRTCYIPKDMTQETLKEGKTIYNDSKKYNTFTKDFETYKNSTISKYENIINNKNLIAEKIEDFLYSLPTFFKFYSKTEFFYTDSLFSTQQTEKERKKLLKIVEKVKNPGREFFNKLLFGEQSMLNQVLTKISLQTNIEKELLYLSTLEEIVGYVNNSKPDNEILKNREKGYVIKGNGESIELFYGNIASEYSKNFYNKSKNEKILKGRIANPGKAKGKVKIFKYNFKTFDSLNKIIESMDKGDILVAETTSPELILACQKAGAIITNQGGMMSHAAIISRELKIPCIVGVDNATDILKDGMMIEVNADIGEINIK